MSKPQAPNQTHNKSTTGHQWDGIEEYNNPLPRWWVGVFVICVIFSIGYVAYYPAWPGGQPTLSGWTSRGQLQGELSQANQAKQVFEKQIENASVTEIENNPELHTYVMAAGKTLFAMNCSQCHGAGGAGTKGYPNLLDDEWIHGGSLAMITQIITHGVRATYDPLTLVPADMPAFGRDELLTTEQLTDVVNYLGALAHHLPGNDSTARGQQIFADNCASCHGDNGQGNREMGAPPLNNDIWQYGGSHDERVATLYGGRAGVMPSWSGKLSAAEIKQLAVYVHGLGGGEPDVVVSATTPEPAQ